MYKDRFRGDSSNNDNSGDSNSIRYSKSEVRSDLKQSKFPLYKYQTYEDLIEEENNKHIRAVLLLQHASVGYRIVPYFAVLNTIKKAIRDFPRVKRGMYILFSRCYEICLIDMLDKKKYGYGYRLANAHLFFAVAFLILCNYDYRKIKTLLKVDSKLSKEEEELISDLRKICKIITRLYFTSHKGKAKKELFKILSVWLPKDIAAVFTIGLVDTLPVRYIHGMYSLFTMQLGKTSAEIPPSLNNFSMN